jgi:hypothetical protein
VSTTLSTLDLVNLTLERCKFGVGSNLVMYSLNEAFREVSQMAPFDWEQTRTTLTITTSAVSVALPADISIGKPKLLGGPPGMLATITYVKPEEFFQQNQFYSTGTALSASPGMYSAWSYQRNFTAAANGTLVGALSNATVTYASGTAFADSWIGQTIVINSTPYTITAHPTSTTLTISPVFASANGTYSFQTSAFYGYTAYLAPQAAAPATGSYSLPFVYHVKPAVLTMSASQFFPSADEFDDALVWMAVASCREIYGVSGADQWRQKAMQRIAPLIDIYKSTNLEYGLRDQAAQTAEATQRKAD